MDKKSQATSIDGLVDQLQNSKEMYVRKVAADRLGEQAKDNEQVLGVLRNVAQSDESRVVRDAAKIAVGKLGEKFEAAQEPWTNWQAVGIGALVSLIPIFLVAVPLGVDFWGKIDIANILLLFTMVTFAGGIIGAVISNSERKNTVWIGAALGATLGGCIGFYFIFVSGVFS